MVTFLCGLLLLQPDFIRLPQPLASVQAADDSVTFAQTVDEGDGHVNVSYMERYTTASRNEPIIEGD